MKRWMIQSGKPEGEPGRGDAEKGRRGDYRSFERASVSPFLRVAPSPRLSCLAALLVLYLGSGFYVVEGNQNAVIRRFGRLVTNEAGNVSLRASGLHYDLPWPLVKIDRVNLNEVRTLTIGSAEVEDVEGTEFLQSIGTAGQSQFLTGDKNILNLQIVVQYRVSEANVAGFLFGSQSAERRLALLAESTAADLVSRSGVDFVHPLGLGQLREMLTGRTRELTREHRLGIEVEEVTINAVYPPVEVKAQFLDVSNARADKQKFIHAASAYAEQRRAAARGEEQRILDEAEIYRQQTVEAARGAADSFTKIIEQLRRDEQQGIQTYAEARQMALRRRYIDAMEDILRNVASKVFLDSGKPVDLTIFRDPKE